MENSNIHKNEMVNKLLEIANNILSVTIVLKELINQIIPINILISRKKEQNLKNLNKIEEYAHYLIELINTKISSQVNSNDEKEMEEILLHFNKAEEILKETDFIANDIELSQLYVNHEGKLKNIEVNNG